MLTKFPALPRVYTIALTVLLVLLGVGGFYAGKAWQGTQSNVAIQILTTQLDSCQTGKQRAVTELKASQVVIGMMDADLDRIYKIAQENEKTRQVFRSDSIRKLTALDAMRGANARVRAGKR